MSAYLFDQYEDMLGEIYCLTFIRGMDQSDALLRMGALADTMRRRPLADAREQMSSYDDGYPSVAFTLTVGSWTLIIEPNGFQGVGVQLLNALSQGTEAVSLLRHDYAEDRFAYSADGVLVTEFIPRAAAFRQGSEPDRFLAQMRAAGLSTDPDQEDEHDPLVHPHLAALRFVLTVTGVLPKLPAGPLQSAHIEPWFSAAEPVGPHPASHQELFDAADSAPAALRHAIAAREVRRLAELLGLDHVPELDEALTAAERGAKVRVQADSALGRRVRDWMTEASRGHHSLNHYQERHRMTAADRDYASQLGWFVQALRGALWSDSGAAFRLALLPLTTGTLNWADDAARRTAILQELRDHRVQRG